MRDLDRVIVQTLAGGMADVGTNAVLPSSMGMAAPASVLISSAADLSTLQVRQIRAYRSYLGGGRPGALVLTVRTAAGPTERIRYGNGLMKIRTAAGTLYGHEGDADGYASFYLFSPEHAFGLVLLTGSGGPWVEELSMAIVGALTENAKAGP